MKIKFSSGNLQLGGNFAQTSNKISVYVGLRFENSYDRRCDFTSLNEGHFRSNADRSDFTHLSENRILHQYKFTELSKFTQRGAVILRIFHNFT